MAKFSMKSPAKINIFLKVTGTRGSYHELLSRFIRLPNLYDEICFESELCQEFTIEGNFSCTRENNSIYKAYYALLKSISEPQKVITFFKNYKIVVDKHIPECGGLVGGPSNAATFLRMTNDLCRLGLSKDELAKIGSSIGADVSFFIYDIESANIKGIGEVVEEFNDDLTRLNIFTPKINCNTAKVYAHFRQFCYNPDVTSYDAELANMKSSDILLSLSSKEANDLCEPTLALYPEMEHYLKNDWFMSGSGNCLNKLEPDVERKLKSLSESEENPSDASLDLETDTCTGEDDVDADNGREANLNLQLGKISDDYNQQGFTDQLIQTDLDEVLGEYLKVLDTWQQEVYNIRIAHHKIWKNSRVSRRIKQHRAGSRVESQTRILPPGKDTDVDYMFELDGILVNCDDEIKDIYWKHSSDSPAFGTVYVDEKYRKQLEQNHSDIFTADTFEWKPDENAFLLLPSKFKENVVNASHFEFSRDKSVSVASPSISGKGAVNEYDTVPCLRLSKWPKLAESWISRGPYSKRYTFSSKWKESLVNVVPLFLVPTGNPLSRNKHEQFRLSFSMVEIKCFDQLTAKMRTNYGISKYAFKRLFCSESCDILSSYHIKTIFFWIVEELRINEWKRISPINFVRTVFSEMKSCILKQSVRHFFVNGCNIFPSHKISDDNISFYNKNFERDTKMISQAVTDLLRSDLDISSDSGNMLNVARSKLRLLASQERIESYIGGYLTRLLSMTTFSLFENELQGTLTESIDNIRTVFSSYQTDKHLKKIINSINIFIVSVQTRNTVIIKLIPSHLNRFDNLTEIAHAAFELYVMKKYSDVESIINSSEGYQFRPGEIGVSITKYHKEYELDTPIHFVICELEKRYNGTCPRFYIDPYLMIKHLQFQIKLKTNSEFRNSETLPTLQKQLLEMEDITKQLSERVPYIGKLSYKFAAVYLIHGYRKQFKELGTNLSLTIPENINLDSFNQRMFAKNFDLR